MREPKQQQQRQQQLGGEAAITGNVKAETQIQF